MPGTLPFLWFIWLKDYEYYKKHIEPILRECREKWVSAGELDKRIAGKAKEYEKTLEDFANSEMEGFMRVLSEISHSKFCELTERPVGDYPKIPHEPIKITAPHYDAGILRWGILLSLTLLLGLLAKNSKNATRNPFEKSAPPKSTESASCWIRPFNMKSPSWRKSKTR